MLGAKTEGCGSDPEAPDNLETCSIPKGVETFLTEKNLATLRDTGFEVNTGCTPPKLGAVLADSLEIVYDDAGGWLDISPYTYRFKRQQSDGHISVTFESEGEKGAGIDGFISGKGNEFSVFVPLSGHSDVGCDYEEAAVISGVWSKNGISGFQQAFIMTAASGAGCDQLMPVGARRIVGESDGLAARLCSDLVAEPGAHKPPPAPPAGMCQEYKNPTTPNQPGWPHWYVCCNDCTGSTPLLTCETFDTGTDAELCGACGAPIWSEDFPVLKAYSCGGSEGESTCRAHCDERLLTTGAGLCWRWVNCFRDCCAAGQPSDDDGLRDVCDADAPSDK